MNRWNTRKNRFRQLRRWAAPLAAVLLLAGLAAPAAAHQPWFNDAGSPDPASPYRLPSALEISQVVYGALTAPEAVDYYTFNAPAGFELSMYVTVPDSPACADYRPAFALLGPGLTQPANMAPAELPPGVPAPPAGSGVVVVAEGEWQKLSDGELAFILGPPFEQRLPGGEYLVAVYDPEGGTGSHGVTTNGEEVVTLPEGFWAKAADWSRCEPMRSAATPAQQERMELGSGYFARASVCGLTCSLAAPAARTYRPAGYRPTFSVPFGRDMSMTPWVTESDRVLPRSYVSYEGCAQSGSSPWRLDRK